MIAIAKSTSQDVCRKLETELVEYYIDDVKCMNLVAGGGGKDTGQTWSFVYLGLAD